jgi:hypothetical protein
MPPTAHPIRAMNWPLRTFYRRDYQSVFQEWLNS